MMAFSYKSKSEFVQLDDSKKCYYLARLYLAQDSTISTMPYKQRLFTCVNYLKKQPKETWSLLYNYLTDNKHKGLMIWSIVPKAVYYDQERRRTEQKEKNVKEYENFSAGMLDEILGQSYEENKNGITKTKFADNCNPKVLHGMFGRWQERDCRV